VTLKIGIAPRRLGGVERRAFAIAVLALSGARDLKG
jgi:hypothetical protein